jgi:hypothetical protein
MMKNVPKTKLLVVNFCQIVQMDLVCCCCFFFTRVPIDLNGEIFFSLMLLLQEVEKGGCGPKFGVLIALFTEK